MEKWKSMKRAFINNKDGFIFIAPQMFLFLTFIIFPIFEGIRISFYKTSLNSRVWVGLNNYIELFSDEIFQKSVAHTMLFVFWTTFLVVLFGFIISSSLFDKNIKYVSFVRGCYYLPAIMSMVVLSIIWIWLLNPAMGLINYYMSLAGLEPVNFLGSPKIALPILIFMCVLNNIGQAVVLYVAAMVGVSSSMLESAEIDGASRLQKKLYIIAPSTVSVTKYLIIINMINVIKVFVVIDLMTSGGPYYSTITMMYMYYTQAFKFYNVGRASAIGIIMFVIIFTLAMIQLGLFRRKDRE
jgi:multiple sugar transport system permease protein